MATTASLPPSARRKPFSGIFKWARKHRVLLGLLVVVVLLGGFNREWIWGQVWISVGHSCGRVYAGIAEEGQVTSCFAQAYAACRPATFEYGGNFGDGTTDDLYIVEPTPMFGGCSLAYRWSEFLASGHLGTSTGMGRCSGLELVDGRRLRLWGCGGSSQDLWIPNQ